MIPSFTSGWPNFAFSDATRRWHAIASSQPPPSANPFTAATMGLGDCSSRRNVPEPLRESASARAASQAASSAMSAPATNALGPAPVTIAARTEPSPSSRSVASPSSVMTASLSALSFSGRLTVMTAMPFLTSYRSVE